MRNCGLDILRFISVVLVLGRHLKPCPPEFSPTLHQFIEVWRTGGWIGVDIFFVLSGYLVSGLLFKEQQRYQSLDLPRFLIRRGLKIYPLFWLLILSTILVSLVFKMSIPTQALLGELLFLQNYLGGLCTHTWSLAVEEHFYFGLALLLGILIKRRPANPFRWLPGVFFAVAAICLIWRAWLMYRYPKFEVFTHLVGTHLRIDSLLFGVLLSYYQHYHSAGKMSAGKMQSRQASRWLALTGVLLLTPAFLFPLETTWWIPVFGYVLFYVGAGCLLWAVRQWAYPANGLQASLALLGSASYSIYLWHLPVESWGMLLVNRVTGSDHYFI